jgi:hypothetical protein
VGDRTNQKEDSNKMTDECDFGKENKSGASRKKTNTLWRCMHGMIDKDGVRFGKKNKSWHRDMHGVIDKDIVRFGKKNKSWHGNMHGMIDKDSVRFGKKNKSWHRDRNPMRTCADVGCE